MRIPYPYIIPPAQSIRLERFMRRSSGVRTLAKKATNVTVRLDLLEAARALGINLSAVLETALLDTLKEARRKQWLEDNREAIAIYNDFASQHGVFSDGMRSF